MSSMEIVSCFYFCGTPKIVPLGIFNIDVVNTRVFFALKTE